MKKWIANAMIAAFGGMLAAFGGMLAACGGGASASLDAPGAAPIDTPPNVWTFVPMAGTTCANGTPAAIAVDRAPTGSSDLFVYFEGGGACWDENTCFTLKSAVRIDAPYDLAAFQMELPALSSSPIFDRSAAGNPFKDATYVYVPYCTGDIHAGTRVATYGAHTVHHTGHTNAQTFVDALRATLPDTARIWVTGSSAGGYGATLDMPLFTAAWPSAEVDVLQDSSLFVPAMNQYATWQTSWALAFPPGCTSCATSFPSVIAALTAAHPASRIGLLTFRDDAVLESYLGYGAGTLAPAIDSLIASQYGLATTHAFELDGTSHTMIGQYATLTGKGGVKLEDWIHQWATGDAAWTTVKP